MPEESWDTYLGEGVRSARTESAFGADGESKTRIVELAHALGLENVTGDSLAKGFPHRGAPGWKREDDEEFASKLESLIAESGVSVESLLEASTALVLSILISFKAAGYPVHRMVEDDSTPIHTLVEMLKKMEML